MAVQMICSLDEKYCHDRWIIVAAALSVPVVKAKIQRKRRSLPGMNVNEEENTRHSFVGKKHDDSSKM